MKKILLSSVALVGLTAGAMAADLPSRVAPAPYVPVPVFTWTGFYVGANAGYGFSGSNNDSGFSGFTGNRLSTFAAPATPVALTGGTSNFGYFGNSNRNRDGFVGGGQIGYNYQIGQFVVGLEADIQYADFGGNNNNNAFSTGSGFGTYNTVAGVGPGYGVAAPTLGSRGNVAFLNNAYANDTRRIDWFGTVRGRVGYAWDRFLVYATGGLAYTDSGNSNGFYAGSGGLNGVPASFFTSATSAAAAASLLRAAPSGFAGQRNNNDIGFAVGGGLEYAFTPNITARIEGLYVNFGNSNKGNGYLAPNQLVGVTNNGAAVTQAVGYSSSNHDLDFAVVRAGINYKFNTF